IGVADWDTGHAATGETLFNLGSTAKAFVPYVLAEIMNSKGNHDAKSECLRPGTVSYPGTPHVGFPDCPGIGGTNVASLEILQKKPTHSSSLRYRSCLTQQFCFSSSIPYPISHQSLVYPVCTRTTLLFSQPFNQYLVEELDSVPLCPTYNSQGGENRTLANGSFIPANLRQRIRASDKDILASARTHHYSPNGHRGPVPIGAHPFKLLLRLCIFELLAAEAWPSTGCAQYHSSVKMTTVSSAVKLALARILPVLQ
ncbi:hypothetical protein PoB_004472900, partial [Plakobranchus ocellatus]